MTPRQLEIFHAVMQTRSISGAARMLRVSAPAVSKMLHHAEDQLGYALFERLSGRLHPTPEAHALFPEAEAAIEGVARAARHAASLRREETATLRVVAAPSFGAAILPRAVARFRTRWAQAPVDVLTISHTGLVERLTFREADIGLTPFPADTPLMIEDCVGAFPMVAAVPAEWDMARRPQLSAADLSTMPLIGYPADSPIGGRIAGWFARLGADFAPTITVRYPMIASMFVQQGVGAAVIDPFLAIGLARPETVLRPLVDAPRIEVWLIRNGETAMSQAARDFQRALRQTVRALVPEA